MTTPRYEAALKRIQSLAASGALPVNRRSGAEAELANAYQEMVRLGLAPQIRGKYRTGH